MTAQQLLFWMDVETDSLDVRDCTVLEWAGFMTTGDLHVIMGSEFHYLADMTPEMVRMTRDFADPIVQEMHDKSGLWDALLGKTEAGLDRLSPELVDARLASLVHWAGNLTHLANFMHEGESTSVIRPPEGWPKKPRFAGSGVAAYDVQIVRMQQYPKLAASLDYTACDVSNVRRFLTDQCGIDIIKNPERPHRADEDILNAWKEAIIVQASVQYAYQQAEVYASTADFPMPTFVGPEF